MLNEPPIPSSVLYGVYKDAEGKQAVRPVYAVNVWCKITAETCEWWVGDGKGDIYEPQDLFASRAEALAALEVS